MLEHDVRTPVFHGLLNELVQDRVKQFLKSPCLFSTNSLNVLVRLASPGLLERTTPLLVFGVPVVEFAATPEPSGWGCCDVCDAEVNTKDGDVLGVACVGIIVLHSGLCPHVKVETVLTLVVVERRPLHFVVIVEQVRRVGRITRLIWQDKLSGHSPVDGCEGGMVVVDRDGSCVVAGEPRGEVRFGGFFTLFPALDDAIDDFCGAIACGLHEVGRKR